MILDYILRRLGLFLFMILMLSIFTFSLSYLFPGDPLSNLSGFQANSADVEGITLGPFGAISLANARKNNDT